jgi:hypothetical protein
VSHFDAVRRVVQMKMRREVFAATAIPVVRWIAHDNITAMMNAIERNNATASSRKIITILFPLDHSQRT